MKQPIKQLYHCNYTLKLKTVKHTKEVIRLKTRREEKSKRPTYPSYKVLYIHTIVKSIYGHTKQIYLKNLFPASAFNIADKP